LASAKFGIFNQIGSDYTLNDFMDTLDDPYSAPLNTLQEKQTKYHNNGAGHAERIAYPTKGDPLANKAFDVIEWIVDKLSNYNFVTNTTEGLHRNNLEISRNVLRSFDT